MCEKPYQYIDQKQEDNPVEDLYNTLVDIGGAIATIHEEGTKESPTIVIDVPAAGGNKDDD